MTTIEATRKICVLQSAESDLLAGTLPAALTGYSTKERTAIIYHDTAAQWSDVAWAASRLVFDPDVQSAPWDGGIANVNEYTAAITTTQRSNLIGIGVNVILPYGGVDTFVDPGVNGASRPLYEIVTMDWFYARAIEAVANEKTRHSARGAKITIDVVGQIKIKSLIDALFEQGSAGASPHFIPGQTECVAVAITQADIDAQRLRFTGRAQIAVGARIFTFTLNFGRTAL
jgi:hypothetical protein